MATALKNLSKHKLSTVENAKDIKIAIAVAEWNEEITTALLKGAVDTLEKFGVLPENITIHQVPGTFELSFAASVFMNEDFDAIIVLGCVIQGETKHFDFICSGVTQGITQLNLEAQIPVVFGVLTTNTLQQAKDRAGGKYGNKGDEAAVTALQMIHFKQSFQ